MKKPIDNLPEIDISKDIRIKVITKAKIEKIKPEKDQNGTYYKIYTNAVAEDGKANEAVLKFLSKYLKVPKSSIKIKLGLYNKEKIIKVTQ